MYYFVLLLWQTKAVIWGKYTICCQLVKGLVISGAQSSSECSLTIAPSQKKIWTDFSGVMCCSVIGGSELLTFWKPANTSSGICACVAVSSLPLCVYFYLDAYEPQRISVQSGLDWPMEISKSTLFQKETPIHAPSDTYFIIVWTQYSNTHIT